ncbi:MULTISPECIES: hypothetical protein [Sphingomonas]|nr:MULTISPECIES: hypothetical protein [Sphingomonas]
MAASLPNGSTHKSLMNMADDYEAALANLLGTSRSLGDQPLQG